VTVRKVAPSLAEIYRRFRGACSIHHHCDQAYSSQQRRMQGLRQQASLKRRETSTRPHVATSQKTVISEDL
jgi:hypothetical protein